MYFCFYKKETMPENKMIVFKTFDNPVEANIILTRLQDAGFECFLSGENMALLYPLFDASISGVQLHIFEKDADKIRSLLEDDTMNNL